MHTQNDLLDTLFVELFQTERSAVAQPEREAERYGDAPPALALRAIARHARDQLAALQELAALEGRKIAKVGVIGEAFSLVRTRSRTASSAARSPTAARCWACSTASISSPRCVKWPRSPRAETS